MVTAEMPSLQLIIRLKQALKIVYFLVVYFFIAS
jgi:hypothetical protein